MAGCGFFSALRENRKVLKSMIEEKQKVSEKKPLVRINKERSAKRKEIKLWLDNGCEIIDLED